MAFVHLSCHTEFSLIDSIVRLKPLIKAAAADKQMALAITDYNNLFALVRFYKGCLDAGIKPIIGAELWIDHGHDDQDIYPVTVLCQNQTGYLNLSWLISEGYLHHQKNLAHDTSATIPWATFAQKHQGLLVLNGGLFGQQAHHLDHSDRLQTQLNDWQQLLGHRFFIEVSRIGHPIESDYFDAMVPLAQQLNIPLVATNPVRFMQASDHHAHDVRVCIGDGVVLDDPNRPSHTTAQQYFRSQAEMIEQFRDLPAAIDNTIIIAQCCNVPLNLNDHFLPDYPIPDGFTIDTHFAKISHKGLTERLKQLFPQDIGQTHFADTEQQYRERLDFELQTICHMKFPGYFLIVMDFIQWAKDRHIPVGPGRGSGAGSLVAYALKITDLDPIKYDLLFERFLNPERVSMPDFDIDFCMDRRDEAIDYVTQRYGKSQVGQIITFGTMAAKAVVRDVGRVLGHPYPFVDRIAKAIPPDLGITLKKALETSPELKSDVDNNEDVHEVIELGMALEGITRNVGKHAAGVIIAPKAIHHFCPIYCEADGSNVVTQLDKKDVETIGLVKFDFLGLRTLTIIDWALADINQQQKPNQQIQLEILDITDTATYDMIKTGHTSGVFQLESDGMQKVIVDLKPDRFEDLVALVALYRPGPLGSGMVDDFILRKHGQQAIVYPHPSIEDVLEPTYGTVLYQEQVMQIAQIMANYSLGGADLLRRAMGKKDKEEMQRQRDKFQQGAIDNNIDPQLAADVFDVMEKFAEYGFNKSHSAAYALITFQTAWLKTHYPDHFMAAVLSSDMDNTDKVVAMCQESRQFQLTIDPPDINESVVMFKSHQPKRIRYGLAAIKGAGENAIAPIISERGRGGAFQDYSDFLSRCGQHVNKKLLESFIQAGVFDTICNVNRTTLLYHLDDALKWIKQQQENQASGQNDLFASEEHTSKFQFNQPQSDDLWQQCQQEKAVLGQFLTQHPLDLVKADSQAIQNTYLGDWPDNQQTLRIVAYVEQIFTKYTKKNDLMAAIKLSDAQGRNEEITVFSDLYEDCEDWLEKDIIVVVEGQSKYDHYRKIRQLTVTRIETLHQYQLRTHQTLQLDLTIHQNNVQWMEAFYQQLMQQPTTEASDQGIQLKIIFTNENGQWHWQLQPHYQIQPQWLNWCQQQNCAPQFLTTDS